MVRSGGVETGPCAGLLPSMGFAQCASARQSARLHLLDPHVFPLPAGLSAPPLAAVLACVQHHAAAGTRPPPGCALDLTAFTPADGSDLASHDAAPAPASAGQQLPAPASNASAAALLRERCRTRLARACAPSADERAAALAEVAAARKAHKGVVQTCAVLRQALAAMEGDACGEGLGDIAAMTRAALETNTVKEQVRALCSPGTTY